jgi:hypothetical protein
LAKALHAFRSAPSTISASSVSYQRVSRSSASVRPPVGTTGRRRIERRSQQQNPNIRIRIGYLYRHMFIDLSEFIYRHSALIARAYELSGAAR